MSFGQITDTNIIDTASGVTTIYDTPIVRGTGIRGTADGQFLVTWRAELSGPAQRIFDPHSLNYGLIDPMTGIVTESGVLAAGYTGYDQFQFTSYRVYISDPIFIGADQLALVSLWAMDGFPGDVSAHVEIRNPTGTPFELPDVLGDIYIDHTLVLPDGSLATWGQSPPAIYDPVSQQTVRVVLDNYYYFGVNLRIVDLGGGSSLLLMGGDRLGYPYDIVESVWAAVYSPGNLEAPFQVNTTAGYSDTNLQAWAVGDDFFFAWNEDGIWTWDENLNVIINPGSDGSGNTLRARFYDPDDPDATVDFILNTTTAGNQSVAGGKVLSDGRVLVVWQDELSDGSGNALRGRIVDPANPTGSPADFRINTSSAGDQTLLNLRVLDDGRVLATWADTGSGSTGTDIRARIIDPANPAGSLDFFVNTTVSGNQTLAATEALADGRQFYLWNSSSGDGSGSAIRARFLDPANPAASADFVVNTTTLGNQNAAELHVLDDGRLLVAWLDFSTGHASYRMRLIDPANPSASVEQVLSPSPGAQSNLQVEILDDGRIGFAWDELQGTATSVRSVIWSLDAPDVGVIRLGGNGNDTFVGTNFADTLRGGLGSDTLIANSGDDFLHGGAGSDVLRGGRGADHMMGAQGDDTYHVDNAGDVVDEGPGSDGVDTVISSISFSLVASPQVIGQIENLTLADVGNINALGNALDNILTGNVGNNVLNGGTGADIMRGDGGHDSYTVDNTGDIVDESTADADGIDLVRSTVSFSLENPAQALGAIENLTLLGSANLDATGNDLANVLTGNAGNNILDGRGGADTMRGGAGNDAYFVENTGDIVDESVAGSGGIDTISSGISLSLTDAAHVLGAIENLTLLGTDNLDATGNDLANLLVGNSGENILDGGLGVDTMQGGAGIDRYIVDNAGDIVDESVAGSDGVDVVLSWISFNMANAATVRGDVENLQLLGDLNLNVAGNALDNRLVGNTGANVLNGGAGADWMQGRGGNDTYTVDNLGDLVDESLGGSNGIDLVRASVSFNMTTQAKGAVENVTLLGAANATVLGNALANVLIGNIGMNTLAGGLGNDTLTGAAGNDLFLFNTALNGVTNVDTITDMNELGNDTIRLAASVFTALTAGALAAGAFHIGAAAADADDRIVYNQATGQLSYDMNGNLAGGSTLFAVLDPGLVLTAADFFVV